MMPVRVSRRGGELAVSLGLLGIAAYVGATAAHMPLGDLVAPGPGLFPLSIAVLLAGIALALVYENRWGHAHQVTDTTEDGIGLVGTGTGTAMAALAGFTAGWSAIGFPIGASLFLAVLFRVLGGVAWTMAVPAGTATGLGLWFVFTYGLGVALPSGPLG